MNLTLFTVCLSVFGFLLVDFTSSLSTQKYFNVSFLFKMTFLGKGCFNRHRIKAPKQRNAANLRDNCGKTGSIFCAQFPC